MRTEVLVIGGGIAGLGIARDLAMRGIKTILVERTTWYGQAYHGRTTASGEIFDATAMTCAHPTLPFGAWLRVGWLGRFVIVRVTDRMPGKSCLDLTSAAFRVLAPHKIGVLHGATIEVLP